MASQTNSGTNTPALASSSSMHQAGMSSSSSYNSLNSIAPSTSSLTAQLQSLAHATSSSSASSLEAQLEADRLLASCMKNVPQVYFEIDFKVTELDFFKTLNDPSSMLLPEKLSHYLDLVEVPLEFRF
jgi:hypothetical protein